ncbi:hypothetical protein VCRA2117O143_1980001 [Vibrio crassostreae]|nr:hypothetical protein VCRA2117O143_1980001 [Vibrio crassostreae]CAK2301128.1 hypothetical protein VCRA2117O142_1970001 [Vibrio crassostreae]
MLLFGHINFIYDFHTHPRKSYRAKHQKVKFITWYYMPVMNALIVYSVLKLASLN